MAKKVVKPKRKVVKRKTSETASTAKAVAKTIKGKKAKKTKKISVEKVVSTGSTLLDLAISGGRRRGGGIPGGIIVEVFGPSSAGKTAIISEIAGNAQHAGGDVLFADPEARLDKEYAEIYQLKLEAENYHRPDTVKELFKLLWSWEPQEKKEGAINMVAADSLAALSTEMEMEEADKMGMKRAKDFSEGLRKTARKIANNNWLICCSNQERDNQGMGGPNTPGGRAIPYYSSLRIRIYPPMQNSKIIKKKKVGKKGKEISKIIGVCSTCEIKKSTVDEPFRTAPIYIVFGLGIDDIRANLQWYKDMSGETSYNCVDKTYAAMDQAIKYIEDNDLEDELKDMVIDLWEEIEASFRSTRKRKIKK